MMIDGNPLWEQQDAKKPAEDPLLRSFPGANGGDTGGDTTELEDSGHHSANTDRAQLISQVQTILPQVESLLMENFKALKELKATCASAATT